MLKMLCRVNPEIVVVFKARNSGVWLSFLAETYVEAWHQLKQFLSFGIL